MNSEEGYINIHINEKIKYEDYRNLLTDIENLVNKKYKIVKHNISSSRSGDEIIRLTPKELIKNSKKSLKYLIKELNEETDYERIIRINEDIKYYSTVLYILNDVVRDLK